MDNPQFIKSHLFVSEGYINLELSITSSAFLSVWMRRSHKAGH